MHSHLFLSRIRFFIARRVPVCSQLNKGSLSRAACTDQGRQRILIVLLLPPLPLCDTLAPRVGLSLTSPPAGQGCHKAASCTIFVQFLYNYAYCDRIHRSSVIVHLLCNSRQNLYKVQQTTGSAHRRRDRPPPAPRLVAPNTLRWPARKGE